MMMIRSNLYQLTTAHPPSKLALTVAKPAAVVLSGKLRALSSVNPKRTHDVPVASTDGNKETKPVSPSKDPEKAPSPPLSLAEAFWRDRMKRTPAFFRPFSSGFDDVFNSDPFFAPFRRGRTFDPFADMMPVLKKDLGDFDSTTLLRSSPSYEIKESRGTYQIAIDVPEGIKASDMKVELEQDGSVLHVTGERKTEENNRVLHTRFDKHFSMGPNIDVEKLSANLDDGVLVVKAPKIRVDDEPPASSQRINITEQPHVMTDDELMQKTYSDAFDESDFAEAGKEAVEKKIH